VKETPFVQEDKEFEQHWLPCGEEGSRQEESTTAWVYGAMEIGGRVRYATFAVVANHDLITGDL